MAVASVSVILTVLVMKLHHCAPQQKRVPKWVRIVVLRILAKLVRCDCTSGVRALKVELQKIIFKRLNVVDMQSCLYLLMIK
jgi:hypothetical protein